MESAARALTKRLAKVQNQIARLQELEKQLATALGAVLAIDEGLSSTEASSSMLSSKMESQSDAVNKRVKIARSMTKGASDAKLALLHAGMTPQDIADKLKVGRSTVDAWCRGTRPIPRQYRDQLKADYGISRKVWLKIAD